MLLLLILLRDGGDVAAVVQNTVSAPTPFVRFEIKKNVFLTSYRMYYWY